MEIVTFLSIQILRHHIPKNEKSGFQRIIWISHTKLSHKVHLLILFLVPSIGLREKYHMLAKFDLPYSSLFCYNKDTFHPCVKKTWLRDLFVVFF